jgi:FdhD protein
MRHCADTDTLNVIDVTLAEGVEPPDASVERSFYTTSACGVCGKTSIEAIRRRTSYDVRADTTRLDPETLALLPDALRSAQRVFARTGGLHAAGLFDASGVLLALREDVGRHNAVDKVVGWALKEKRLPLSGHVLLVSGRASFELTQKAMLAGIPALAAVSAPSSLAVDLAEEAGMTLVGFLRGRSMNVYTGAERLTG